LTARNICTWYRAICLSIDAHRGEERGRGAPYVSPRKILEKRPHTNAIKHDPPPLWFSHNPKYPPQKNLPKKPKDPPPPGLPTTVHLCVSLTLPLSLFLFLSLSIPFSRSLYLFLVICICLYLFFFLSSSYFLSLHFCLIHLFLFVFAFFESNFS
jgi:hypothetical protein